MFLDIVVNGAKSRSLRYTEKQNYNNNPLTSSWNMGVNSFRISHIRISPSDPPVANTNGWNRFHEQLSASAWWAFIFALGRNGDEQSQMPKVPSPFSEEQKNNKLKSHTTVWSARYEYVWSHGVLKSNKTGRQSTLCHSSLTLLIENEYFFFTTILKCTRSLTYQKQSFPLK